MSEEKKGSKAWAIAGYVAGGVLAIAGLYMGIAGGFDSTTWWTLGTAAALVVAGLLYQFGVIVPEAK